MTAATGFARSYGHLLAARVGLGIGESGTIPATHSMISDAFAPSRRAFAIGVFQAGSSAGILIGYLSGAWLNEFVEWRQTFIWFGVVGLFASLVLRFTLHEPKRKHSETARGFPKSATSSGLRPMLQLTFAQPGFAHMLLGCALSRLAGSALHTWMPPILIRSHHMSIIEVGTWLALALGAGGGLGYLGSGWLVSRLGALGPGRYPLVPGLGMAIGLPFAAYVLLSDRTDLVLAAFFIPCLTFAGWVGAFFAFTHGLVPNQMRAIASATFNMVFNLIGVGLGPFVGGVISDLLAARLGSDALRYGLAPLVCATSICSVVHFWLAMRALSARLR